MRAIGIHAQSIRTTGAIAVIACAAVAMTGCAAGHFYQAAKMPAEFQAPHMDNAQTLDLSQLATHSGNSNAIDCGDLIEITISTGYAEHPADSVPVRVGEDGNANIPLVGPVALAGLEMQSAEQAIAAVCVQRGLYRNPDVTVEMKQQRTNKVTVVGAVEKPGTYELPRRKSDLLEAIVSAGGLSKSAGTNVEIRHPGATDPGGKPAEPGEDRVASESPHQLTGFQRPIGPSRSAGRVKIDLVAATKQGGGNLSLDDGDVLMVERRDREPIHVIGLVTKPGEFDLPVNQDLHVLDAVALAGGQSSQVADKVHLIRRMPGREEPVVVEISLREAKRAGKGNMRLAPGDVVSIEQTPATVTLEALKSFIHFGVGATMPIFQ